MKPSTLCATLCVTALALPLAAQAADEDKGSEATLAEVVVTAQKKVESAQDAPVSVTSLSGEAIAASGIKDPIEIQNKLPGLEFQVANTPVAVIRGVGTYNNQPGVDSAVSYVIDGTYLSHHPALMPIMFDISSVEAVRGPQGTLYGRNSNGGAININTNKPVLGKFQSTVSLTAGNYSAFGSELMLNAPLSDTTALRVAFANDNHDGYFGDGLQGADNYAGRARLLVEPSDNLNFLFTVDYSKKSHKGQGSAYCPPNSAYAACATVPWQPYAGYGGGEAGAHFDIENYGAYAEINYRTDVGTLTSLTNFRKYNLKNLWVWDFVDYEPDNDNKFITQELRFARNGDSKNPLDWVVGAFYSRETLNAIEAYSFFGVPALLFSFDDGHMTSKAVFGQVTYPFTDNFSVTGGLRYTDETKSMFGSATVFDATGTIPTTVPTGARMSEGRATWKVGLDYKPTDKSMIYASASNGFKSGGVNQVPPGLGLTDIYQPEKVLAYQLGTKNRFMGDRLQLNAEVFHYKYEGYQQYSQESDPTGVYPSVFFITQDSQRATFYGGEVEASILVSDNGQLDLAATFLHARFDEFVVGAINNTGHDVQGAPKNTLSAAYQHRFPLASGGEIRGWLGSQYVAGHYVANNNARGSFQSAYTKTDLNLSYTSASREWTVTAFARNLEDEAVMASYADPISRGGDIGFLQAPRTFGLTLNWSIR